MTNLALVPEWPAGGQSGRPVQKCDDGKLTGRAVLWASAWLPVRPRIGLANPLARSIQLEPTASSSQPGAYRSYSLEPGAWSLEPRA